MFCGRLYQVIESMLNDARYQVVDDILNYIEIEGNHFDDLIQIVELCNKHYTNLRYLSMFRTRLVDKVYVQRGEGSSKLIQRIMKVK